MTEQGRFEQLIQDALVHLYDYAYLQRLALALGLSKSLSDTERGRVLRRLLLDAIQDLKPPREAPPDSLAWHHYQYLYLRYVESKPVTEIAADLSVGERQTRRRHREALSALAHVLRERWPRPDVPTNGIETSNVNTVAASVIDPALLTQEVERVEALEGNGLVDVAELVIGAIATVGHLAKQRTISVNFVRSPMPVHLNGNRVVLRQAVIEAITYAIECANAEERDGRVEICVQPEKEQCVIRLRLLVSSILARTTSDGDNLDNLRRLLQIERGTCAMQRLDKELILDLTLPTSHIHKVLVVDDSRDMLQLYRRYVSGSPYRVVEATSGDEAIELAREIGPTCIILDIMLPTRDGWEVLQVLRSTPFTRDLPVVVCSVLRQSELALSLGATAFLAKPVTRQSLLATLQSCGA